MYDSVKVAAISLKPRKWDKPGNADKVAVQMKGSYPSLASSCQSSNSLAFPAVRLKAVTDALAPASSFDTICLDSLDQTMQTVARSMAQSVLLSPCKP